MMRRFGYETMRRDVLGAKGSTPQWVGVLLGCRGMMATRDVPYTVDGALYWAVYRAMTQGLAGVVYQAVNMEPPFPGLEFYLAAAVR